LPNTACTVIVFFIEAMPIWFQMRPKSARLTWTSASSRTSPREEISLLLVISLEGYPVPGPQQRLQEVSRSFGADEPALHHGRG